MKRLSVKAPTPCDVLIGETLLRDAGDLLRSAVGQGARAVLLTARTAGALWGDKLEASLSQAGLSVSRIDLPDCDAQTVARALHDAEPTEKDALVVLGGGSLLDAVGNALKGEATGGFSVFLPTTLSAMLDTAVGGTTGGEPVPLPRAVFCDPCFLSTVPEDLNREGLARAIRYAVLFDRTLFDPLYGEIDYPTLIRRCLSIKLDFLSSDPERTGASRLLDGGRILGAAANRAAGGELTPGEEIALGLAMSTRIARKNGFCRRDFLSDLTGLLTYRGLPHSVLLGDADLCAELSALSPDGTLELVLPRRLGECGVCRVKTATLTDLLPS